MSANGKRNILMAGIILVSAGTMALAAGLDPLDDLAMMGEEAMNAGRYSEAIKNYEKIVEKGATYINLLSVKFDLAWAYYLTEQFEKAIPLFDALSGVRAPSEEVKQQSLFLLGECYARLANTQPEDDSSRKKNIKQALELQTRFQTDYPKNKNMPASFYGRAFAYFLDAQYENAAADLKTVIEKYPNSPTARDAYYLLASVYSQQALKKIKAGKKSEAGEFVKQARDIFSQLAKAESNLAMANESHFALAETWFNAGQYRDAIRYYREVRSKNDVLQNLKLRLNDLMQRLAEEHGKGEDTSPTKAALDKLKAQQAGVSESADLMVSAYFRVADAFYRLKRYDEARLICRHLLHFTQAEQKQQAGFLIVSTYLEEKDVDNAAREFEEFQQAFGADVAIAETADLAIGQLYLSQGNVESALPYFTKSAEEYPKGKLLEDSLYLKFTSEYVMNQYEPALKTVAAYLEQFPKGNFVPNALYYQAMSHAALNQWDDALKTITEVIEKFPKKTENFESVDEVCYQKGWMLVQMKKNDEAIKQLETFLERFKDSKLRPQALYQLGVAFNAAGQPDKAKVTLQSISKQFPQHEIAPLALYQVAVMYYEKKDYANMAEAMEALVYAFPANAIAVDGFFWLGWIARNDGRADDAVEYLTDCLEAAPAQPRAPECLLLIAQAHLEKAEKMGVPTVLPEEKKAIYRAIMLDAARTFEDLLANYPDSDQALEALPGVAQAVFTLVRFKQMSEDGAVAWFNTAMARHKDATGMQSLLKFALGSYLLKNREKDKALAAFKESLALNPDVRLSPTMLAEYADALMESNALADAEAIYDKIINEYPNDPRAPAPAWFGKANIKYRQKDFAAAGELYDKVLKEYAWYEPGKQGRVKLAMVLEQQQKYAEAEKNYRTIWQKESGDVRIGAMVGVARCQLAQAEIAKRESRASDCKDRVRSASEIMTKVTVLFPAYTDYASEALWLLGRACELVEDIQKAKEMYYRCTMEYKNTASAKLAAERLQKLGGYTPPPPGATK